VKTGLIILDMLEDFVGGKLANPATRPIVEPIAALAQKARHREDWVVIYANDAHQPGDFEFKVFGEHALAGSPGAQVISESDRMKSISLCRSATTPHSPTPTWTPPAGCVTSDGS
jgi:nicotinamidase-related amidase